MKHLIALFIVVGVLGFIPQQTFAYFTTGSNSFSVNGVVAVFTIDYAFGHKKYGLTMPLVAERQSSSNESALLYDVVTEDGVSGKGRAYAVILSDSSITDETYRIEKGKSASFRLLTLYERTPEEAGKTFTLRVTRLPFAFTDVQNLGLTTPELSKYVTDPLTLLVSGSLKVTPRIIK